MGIFSNNVMGFYNPDLQNTRIADFPRYDFAKPVKPQARYLTPSPGRSVFLMSGNTKPKSRATCRE